MPWAWDTRTNTSRANLNQAYVKICIRLASKDQTSCLALWRIVGKRIRKMHTPKPKAKDSSPLPSTRKLKQPAKAKKATKAPQPKKHLKTNENTTAEQETDAGPDGANADKMLQDVVSSARPKMRPSMPACHEVCKLLKMKERGQDIRQIKREGSTLGQITSNGFGSRLESCARCLLCAAGRRRSHLAAEYASHWFPARCCSHPTSVDIALISLHAIRLSALLARPCVRPTRPSSRKTP